MTQEVEAQQVDERQAREDWEQRIYRRLTDTSTTAEEFALPAPASVTAVAGVGHVKLSWDEVHGAAGYLIERKGPDGERRLVQHGGSDVPAVAGTHLRRHGPRRWLGVPLSHRRRRRCRLPVWEWSTEVEATILAGDPGTVTVEVDAATPVGTLDRVWRMVGSERLTQLTFGDDGNGNDIGSEFADGAAARARRPRRRRTCAPTRSCTTTTTW